jgi:hypothetical protein
MAGGEALMSAVLGIFGCGLLCLAALATVFRLQRFSIKARVAATLGAALAVFVPLGDLSIAAYVRGATGDLSVTTLVLAGAACATQLNGRTVIPARDLRALSWLVALGAAFLYPFALGWTPFDPYALGYGSTAFVAVLLAVALAAWHFRLNVVVLIVVAAALAYLAGAYDSRNLWDTLIDPLASLYAIVALLRAALDRAKAAEA